MYIVYNSKIMIQTGGTTNINDVKIYKDNVVFIGKNLTLTNISEHSIKSKDSIYAFENENTKKLYELMDTNKSFFSKSLKNDNSNVKFTKIKDAKPECTLYMGINDLGTKETTVKNLLYKKGNEYISLDNDNFITYLLEKFNKHREFGEFIIAVYVYELMKSKGKEGGQSRRSRQSRHNRQDAKPKRRTIKKVSK